jgi:hypothetical protein
MMELVSLHTFQTATPGATRFQTWCQHANKLDCSMGSSQVHDLAVTAAATAAADAGCPVPAALPCKACH